MVFVHKILHYLRTGLFAGGQRVFLRTCLLQVEKINLVRDCRSHALDELEIIRRLHGSSKFYTMTSLLVSRL